MNKKDISKELKKLTKRLQPIPKKMQINLLLKEIENLLNPLIDSGNYDCGGDLIDLSCYEQVELALKRILKLKEILNK